MLYKLQQSNEALKQTIIKIYNSIVSKSLPATENVINTEVTVYSQTAESHRLLKLWLKFVEFILLLYLYGTAMQH